MNRKAPTGLSAAARRRRARPEARKAALFWLARTESQSLPAACHASASQEKGRGKALAAFISLLYPYLYTHRLLLKSCAILAPLFIASPFILNG